MSADALVAAARALCIEVDRLKFATPVTHVYNPLAYAWAPHEQYLRRYGDGGKRVVFLGMNPGPFGMAQIGVPFGEIAAARDWLRLDAQVQKPARENPAKPVEGWACRRSEVSGQRLWGLFRERFGTPENFFREHFVANYCPLAFFADGRNLTPDKLPVAEIAPLQAACDRHLQAVMTATGAQWLIGIGAYAEAQAQRALAELNIKIGRILHPSPASPAANRGWAEQAVKAMMEMGVWK
ncbi:MAG: single-stranded DNA-binding protein [Pseudomonadota bacterium]